MDKSGPAALIPRGYEIHAPTPSGREGGAPALYRITVGWKHDNPATGQPLEKTLS